MPHVRQLAFVSETSTLTTLNDSDTGKDVALTTADPGGEPTAVEVDAVSFTLTVTIGTTRRWLGAVGSKTWQIETVGGYPGLIAYLLT